MVKTSLRKRKNILAEKENLNEFHRKVVFYLVFHA